MCLRDDYELTRIAVVLQHSVAFVLSREPCIGLYRCCVVTGVMSVAIDRPYSACSGKVPPNSILASSHQDVFCTLVTSSSVAIGYSTTRVEYRVSNERDMGG